MLHRRQTALLVIPAILVAALVFALAPACTMPACSSMMGLAGIIDHGHGCQDYMMVDDNPDGITTPQAPAVAVVAVALPPAPTVSPVALGPTVEVPLNPEYDPLGVRIRI